jgi:hypothetical protein
MENCPWDRKEENRNDDNFHLDGFSFSLERVSRSWMQRQHRKSLKAFQMSGLRSERIALTASVPKFEMKQERWV